MTSDNGFTLIEIIATIIIMGILAAFFIHFMGTAIDNSSKSMELVTGEAEAEGILEEIIAYYTSEINRDPDNALATLVSRKDNGDFGNISNITMEYITFDDVSGNEIAAVASDNLKVNVQIIADGDERSNRLTAILTKSRNSTDDPIVYY